MHENIPRVKNKTIYKMNICIRSKNLTYSIAFLNLPDNFFQPVSIETMQFIQDIMSFAKCFLCTYYEKGKD